MRTKTSCQHCSTHLEFDSSNTGATIDCPHCHRPTRLEIQAAGKPMTMGGPTNQRTTSGNYMIRWRGRAEGPLSLQEINARVDAGQLGLLTEVQIQGRWITLREFFSSQPAPEERELVASPESNIASPPAPRNRQGAAPAEVSQTGKGKRLIWICAGVALGLIIFGALTKIALKHGEPSKSERAGGTPATISQAAVVAITTNSEPKVPGLNTNAPISTASLTTSQTTVAANATRTESTNSPPKASNAVAALPTVTNSPPTPEVPTLPPLPENEVRTFRLKNHTNYVGTIIHVDGKGMIIKLTTPGVYTSRLAWDLFDEEAISREPKVIAFRKAQEASRLAAERARIAAEQAAERARAQREEEARRLAEYHTKQDAVIESSINRYGWQCVTKGYLSGWGSQVSIGEIFRVVAPGARWSAAKLASYEPERYTHYLVEAKWTNDDGDPVEMQYLVTADGANFHLHGCFVSGSKMADGPFITAVKAIWNRKQ
jgi:hypothetical protein